ncbi:MAG TPA: metalloregulator ArsR/SmtB family transcription factor [Eudoraea sp.]|nr:metalloregulator ArsR/SmtB family transcription factor [Eudoraea sp.]
MKAEVVFGALSDESRLKMVKMLGMKDCTVEELMTGSRKSQSSTSQHLKVLLEAGLVSYSKFGNFRIYTLRRNELNRAMRFFDNLWEEDLNKLKAHHEKKNK